MFTGIIEETATLRSKDVPKLWFDASFAAELKIGDSVSCSGVCLTVVESDERGFCVEAVQETLDRTSLADLKPGYLVNVERAMPADGRFDGHIVQGHVDGVGKVKEVKSEERGDIHLIVELPNGLNKYVVQKGSICLDGISLTVVEVQDNEVKVAIIPHTWEHTNLSKKKVGDKVNVEVDVIAKYVQKLVSSS